jgi:hypothetical protein
MDDSERQVQLLLALENSFTDPTFLTAAEELIAQAESIATAGEQSLQSHLLWQRFTGLVEARLKEFLEGREEGEREVYEACKQVFDQDPQALTCFEYIFAGAEYEEFLEMLLTRKRAQEWSVAEDPSPS